MRNTCALNIPRIPARVQQSVVTNAQLFCDTPMRPRLTHDDNGTADTSRTTPFSDAMGSPSNLLRFAADAGRLASPSALLRGKGSTYASSCYVPPKGPFPDPLAWGK